jgi:ParB-like chromosome segregation protein Spo0J
MKQKSKKWHTEVRNIDQLTAYSKNARRLTQDQYEHLKKSIDKFGLIDKPIISHDNVIIGGHQRIEVLKKMKAKNVECYVPDSPLTDKEIEELNIRLNKNTGEWDFDMLANEWDEADLFEWGFTEQELHCEEVKKEEKPKTFALTAKFENEDDLRQAELDIAAVIDKYASASYEVKIK